MGRDPRKGKELAFESSSEGSRRKSFAEVVKGDKNGGIFLKDQRFLVKKRKEVREAESGRK